MRTVRTIPLALVVVALLVVVVGILAAALYATRRSEPPMQVSTFPAASGDADLTLEPRCPGKHSYVLSVPAGSTEPAWATEVALEARATATGDGVVVGSTLPGTSRSETVAVLDAADGRPRWQATLPPGELQVPPPTADDHTVVVATNRAVRVVDARDGTARWSWNVPDPTYTSTPATALDATAVYLGEEDGGVTARSRDDGELRWSRPDLQVSTIGNHDRTIVAGPTVVVATTNELVGLDPSDGATRWSHTAPAEGFFSGPLASTTDLVLVRQGRRGTPADDRLLAVDPTDGTVRWQQPARFDEALVVYPFKPSVASTSLWSEFDAETGAPLTEQTHLPRPDGFTGYRLRFVGVHDGNVLWLAENGSCGGDL